MWLFVGMLLGSMVTSSHDTKEACEGRRVVLAEKGVNGQCVQALQFQLYNGCINCTGTIQLAPSR